MDRRPALLSKFRVSGTATGSTTEQIGGATGGVLIGISIAVAGVVYALTGDGIFGVAVGAGSYAIGARLAKARKDHAAR